MCQPQNKGGQRCASHTRNELAAATAAHTRACAATAAAHADLRAAANGARDPRNRTPENQAAVSGASAALTLANGTRDAANSVLHAARVTHAQTPKGRAETLLAFQKTTNGDHAAALSQALAAADDRNAFKAQSLATAHRKSKNSQRPTKTPTQTGTSPPTVDVNNPARTRKHPANTVQAATPFDFEAHVAHARTARGKQELAGQRDAADMRDDHTTAAKLSAVLTEAARQDQQD